MNLEAERGRLLQASCQDLKSDAVHARSAPGPFRAEGMENGGTAGMKGQIESVRLSVALAFLFYFIFHLYLGRASCFLLQTQVSGTSSPPLPSLTSPFGFHHDADVISPRGAPLEEAADVTAVE